MNTFGYVEANPVSFFDPLGLEKVIFFNPDDPDQKPYRGAVADPDRPGVCVIYAHGNPNAIRDDRGSSPEYYRNNPEDLQRLKAELKELGCEEDMPVEFASCNTGKGDNSIAQNFSRIWKPNVGAPDQFVWWDWRPFKYSLDPTPYGETPDGGKDKSNPGKYRNFRDGKPYEN